MLLVKKIVREFDVRGLKSVCDTCPWIIVQAEEGGDWSALLCNRNPESFVDVYSPQDNYSTKTLGMMIWIFFF